MRILCPLASPARTPSADRTVVEVERHMVETADQAELQEVDEPNVDVAGPPLRRLRISASRRQLGVGLTVVAVLIAAVVWLISGEEGPSPAQQLQEAFRLLDDRDNLASRQEAGEIAERLEAEEYRDRDFPGAVEYILGMTAFRDAENRDEVGREPLYELAAHYLRDAKERVLPEDRLGEWAYALGTSLHRIGEVTEARPRLEEAVKTYPPGRVKASIRLTEIDLDLKTPESLAQALQLSAGLLRMQELDKATRVQTHMQRAQIYLALERYKDLEEELEELKTVSPEEYRNQGTIVFRAQVLMAEKKYDDALILLEPIANHIGLNPTYPRQALYLQGVCHEAMGRNDAAISSYARTAEKYQESHEGLAANLRMADLLRADEKHEQARDAYKRALQMVRQPRDFRNRWLSLDEFREIIRNAWDAWCAQHAYRWAIDLSKAMTPLLPEVEANELRAEANRRWAEHLEEELQKTPYSKRPPLRRQLRERRRQSGKAYADLANTLRTSSRYSGELWNSAQHYYKGHDFESALIQLTRFINTRPKTGLPQALVLRGRVLMDLGRLDEAQEHFERVIENYPAEGIVFDAQFLTGKCHLERNELDLAEKTWRSILTSPLLKPGAGEELGSKEWRLALFSLGRLLYYRAAMLKSQAEVPQAGQPASEMSPTLVEAFARWDESSRRLEEFLKRYPSASQAIEARYLLAKSLQHRAELPRRKLETAETDNARLELRRTMHAWLEESRREFQLLQKQLLLRDELDQLDELGQKILRDCYFEIAHTYYALSQYDQAIVSYGSAANKFAEDPQVILAYVQMSNCYDRRNKPQEAQSMLEQAKVIISQMSDDVFQQDTTNMTRKEWDDWLDWARQLRHSAPSDK